MSKEENVQSLKQLKTLSHIYSSNVPRYTSFPPINRWEKKRLSPDEILIEFRERLAAVDSIDLYVHVPFCASLCYFCACHKQVSRKQEDGDRFLISLEKEILYRMGHVARKRIQHLHFGGGSPTWLSVDQWHRLMQLLRKHFQMDAQTAISIELDSRTLTDAHIVFFAETGVTRVSFGIQDSNREVQRAIHREQDWERLVRQVALLRQHKIQAINFDLVYGLPLQTKETILKTISQVLLLRPTRIALYSYAHVPQMAPAQKLLEKFERVQEDEKIDLFFSAYEALMENGYVAVGLDHFCLPHDALYDAYKAGRMQRSFMGYTEQGSTLTVGIGPSAISDFGSGYFQTNKSIKSWLTGDYQLETWHLLTQQQKALREEIWNLMCRWEVPQNSNHQWKLAAQEFERNKLLRNAGEGYEVTELGRPFIRNMAHRLELSYSST